MLLDGTGDYLSIPTSNEFGFGTADFTVECWIRPANVSGNKVVFDFADTGGDQLVLIDAQLRYFSGSFRIFSTTNLVADRWYHIAVSRSGGTTKMFIDGVQEGSDYTDSTNYGTTNPFYIGADNGGSNLFTGPLTNLEFLTLLVIQQHLLLVMESSKVILTLDFFFTLMEQMLKHILKIGLVLKTLLRVRTLIMMPLMQPQMLTVVL